MIKFGVRRSKVKVTWGQNRSQKFPSARYLKLSDEFQPNLSGTYYDECELTVAQLGCKKSRLCEDEGGFGGVAEASFSTLGSSSFSSFCIQYIIIYWLLRSWWAVEDVHVEYKLCVWLMSVWVYACMVHVASAELHRCHLQLFDCSVPCTRVVHGPDWARPKRLSINQIQIVHLYGAY